MPEPKMIKAVAKIMCPNCSKEVLVSFRSYMPTIDWALKEEDLKTAKEKLKNGLEEISFIDPKKKEEILSQLEQEEFMVGPEEIVPIIEQLKKDNIKEEKDDTKKNTDK